MLKKKEKKSYGAYNDYFLDDCEVVTKSYDITHVHVKEFKGVPEGIYRYEPGTGILSLDEEHFGVMNFKAAIRASQDGGRVVLLKHKTTWSDLEERGIVKKSEEADVAQAAQSMMAGMTKNVNGLVKAATAINPRNQPIQLPPQAPTPPETKTGGFLKKLFNK